MSRTATADAIAHDEATNGPGCMDRLGRFNKQKREKIERRALILKRLATVGVINRKHIRRRFRVSRATASADIRWLKSTYPGALTYDQPAGVHRLTETAAQFFLPVLAMNFEGAAPCH